jgi:hypothetical protein
MEKQEEQQNNVIKTTISCPKSTCDINGQVLPNGNYYFTISKYNDSYCRGSLTAKGQYGEFTFKTIDIVKMMSIAQSRLARRSGLEEDGMPDYISPPISPENSNLVKQLDEKEVVHNYFYTPDQCSVCLSMISDNRKKLLCGHSFHNLCISQWLARDQRCPVCRTIHVEKSSRRNSEPVVSRQMEVESDGNNNNTSLPSLNLRHRYNNYVIPRNNYVDGNAHYRRTIHESKYCYKK